MMDDNEYSLPRRIPLLLKVLVGRYLHAGEDRLIDVIKVSRIGVDTGITHDNWNGGQTGHDLILYLPLEEIVRLTPAEHKDFCERITNDINNLVTRSNEFIASVHFEASDESDADYQAAPAFSSTPSVDPNKVEFWKPGLVRVFISHRDGHKKGAHALASALATYGLSCFVAHDQIRPMTEWRKEIIMGLQTMEVMVVYLTDDFDDSAYCNQEVGYALGANKPIVCLKLGSKSPPAFIDNLQALRGDLTSPQAAADKLYGLVSIALGVGERLNDGLIEAFLLSEDFTDTKLRFDRMTAVVKSLTPKQLNRIIDGFHKNDQLFNAGHLTSKNQRLTRWLKEMTGFEWEISSRTLMKIALEPTHRAWDDIPF